MISRKAAEKTAAKAAKTAAAAFFRRFVAGIERRGHERRGQDSQARRARRLCPRTRPADRAAEPAERSGDSAERIRKRFSRMHDNLGIHTRARLAHLTVVCKAMIMQR
jgi:hypothetical protein